MGSGCVRSPGSRPPNSPSRTKGSSGCLELAFRGSLGPLTVAGPRRILTGFRDDPPVETNCTIIFGWKLSGVNGDAEPGSADALQPGLASSGNCTRLNFLDEHPRVREFQG